MQEIKKGDKISTLRIELIKGDITKVMADAIVNAANSTLLGGGGVDAAIHRAAGPKLLAECATLKGCATGSAKITKGYNLPAKFVIHTVGPVWSGGKHSEEKLLAGCYSNCLSLAREHSLESIAFPSISTGAYRFPIKPASRIALNTVKTCLEKDPGVLKKVIFVLFSDNDLAVYQENYRDLFPES
ncbi:MAG: O-acetyl-ADP-ribose deacetylase [Candidatus Omnitrophica bacterium]|nr:O-acetyl-ADP-ribose deacetylase [Candidatus Omnitrophota bacterium]